ncbi:hypothetical protein ABE61_00175 [Lysinibacillus sphaericus]|uniref:hypothetical protein n=1 Tax=Lysinibacillus sphaericus TaxID=1421 RepID=UPI0018CE007D|nr:hypothetical protein [Lysinibacillus sphaericus]MBG9452545.1 hypothetical protein [Lysinibacillus sphaericus]MBG9477292.1 hypothetical protein [Lysinibacillus sphaericus]MBG9592798.1 hypothetical protein [Lysinibacillus sphaericus]
MNKLKIDAIMRSIFQIVVLIFGIGCVFYIIIKDPYSTPPKLVIVSITVAILYLFIIGSIKLFNSGIHENQIFNGLAIYLILGLITIFLAVFSWVYIQAYLNIYTIPTKVADILAVLSLIITLSSELVTDLINYFLKKPKPPRN